MFKKFSFMIILIVSLITFMSCENDSSSESNSESRICKATRSIFYNPTGEWYNYLEEITNYDSKGNVCLIYNEVYKNDYSYDSTGLLTENNSFEREEEGGDWIEKERYEIVHDQNGDPTCVFRKEKYGDQFIKTSKMTFLLEGGMLKSLELYAKMEGEGENWFKVIEDEYIYENNILMEMNGYEFDGSEMSKKRKSSYEYDEDGYLKTLTSFNMTVSSTWKKETSREFKYSGNKITEMIYGEYSIYPTRPDNELKYTYTYDSENNNTSCDIDFMYHNNWEKYKKRQHSFEDGHGNFDELNKIFNPSVYYTGLYNYSHDDNNTPAKKETGKDKKPFITELHKLFTLADRLRK